MKKDLAKEIYDDGYVTGYKASIEEFQDDLDSLSPDIPYSYKPLSKLREKWE